MVRGVLRPGIQKGDHFDVEVRIPSQSDTTSLRGGRLLEVRLTEVAVLGGQVHQGGVAGAGRRADHGRSVGRPEGRPRAVGPWPRARRRRLPRRTGRWRLVLKPGKQIGLQRPRGSRPWSTGGSTPTTRASKSGGGQGQDRRVRRAGRPSALQGQHRALRRAWSARWRCGETNQSRWRGWRSWRSSCWTRSRLRRRRWNWRRSATAGVPALLKGSRAADPEVRFYAAEALAYLDHGEAVEVLAQTAPRHAGLPRLRPRRA